MRRLLLLTHQTTFIHIMPNQHNYIYALINLYSLTCVYIDIWTFSGIQMSHVAWFTVCSFEYMG